MHSLFFDTKRAHRATLKFINPLLARVETGLTQARYDVMHALGFQKSRIKQSDLWKLLGVHASTMSKLLHALLELGLVDRRRLLDARQWWIALTERGRGVLARARRFLMRFVSRSVLAAVLCRRADVLDLRFEFETFLRRFRLHFGDGATLVYEPGWPPLAD